MFIMLQLLNFLFTIYFRVGLLTEQRNCVACDNTLIVRKLYPFCIE